MIIVRRRHCWVQWNFSRISVFIYWIDSSQWLTWWRPHANRVIYLERTCFDSAYLPNVQWSGQMQWLDKYCKTIRHPSGELYYSTWTDEWQIPKEFVRVHKVSTHMCVFENKCSLDTQIAVFSWVRRLKTIWRSECNPYKMAFPKMCKRPQKIDKKKILSINRSAWVSNSKNKKMNSLHFHVQL